MLNKIAVYVTLKIIILISLLFVVDRLKSPALETRITLSQRSQPDKLYAVDKKRVRVKYVVFKHTFILK